MIKISAVICELNPFHKGHAHVLSAAKENSDTVIAVMSGNFVQRGECAVYDKYKRARAAIEGGADLCVELPFPFSSSSAEYFSEAGVRIAESLFATDLWFGSECADLNALLRAAEILNGAESKKTGRAAENRAETIKSGFSSVPESILSSPNDILAVEYCRRATVSLHPVKRIPGESAGAIREKLYLSDSRAVKPERLTELEFHHFRTLKAPPQTAECTGGVGGRLCNASVITNDFRKWLELAATKRYTNSRLKRAALFALCSVLTEDIKEGVRFTRVLSANEKGRRYLSSIRKCCDFPVVTNPSDRFSLSGTALSQYNAADFADKLYTLCAGMDDPAAFSKIHPQML